MLKVEFGALDTAAADIGTRANADLAPLRADWTGEASAAYQSAKATWTRAIADMRQVLAQLGSAVSASNADYRAGEKLNAGRW